MQPDDPFQLQLPEEGVHAGGEAHPVSPAGRLTAPAAPGQPQPPRQRDSLRRPATTPSHGFARVGTPLRIQSDTDQSP